MYSRQYIRRTNISNSASTPVNTSLLQQPKDEANLETQPSQQAEAPDLQTQLEKAARFGHNFSQIQVQTDTPAVIQPKIAIGVPGDQYEQEADSVAAQVMSMDAPATQQSIQRQDDRPEDEEVQAKPLANSITPLIQRQDMPEAMPEEEQEVQAKPLANSITPLIQRQDMPEEEQEVQAKPLANSITPLIQRQDDRPEDEEVQAKPLANSITPLIQRQEMPAPEEESEEVQTKLMLKPRAEAGSVEQHSNLESQLNQSKGSGSPLPDEVRSFMEPRFGCDFSQVRVHTDGEAVQMNQALSAQAFTHGSDIYFGAGKSPSISDLTAHELTHVVQQTGQVRAKLNFDPSEHQYKPETQPAAPQLKTLTSSLNHQSIQRQTAGTQSPTQTVEVSNSVQEAPYGWTAAYEVQLTDQECTVTIRVRINPDADVSTRDVARVQSVTANEFARYFDHRFNLRDAQGTSRPLRVRLQYVDSGEHLTIALHSGTGRDDLSNWFVDSEAIDRAHELGHQLGLKDEYVDASVPNRATATSPGVSHDHSLMGNYYEQGIRNADVRGRHGDQLAADISSATGTQFSAEFSDVYIVRRGDNLSTIALRIYGNESMWQQIHELNRDKIRNPNLILPGLQLRLPPIPH